MNDKETTFIKTGKHFCLAVSFLTLDCDTHKMSKSFSVIIFALFAVANAAQNWHALHVQPEQLHLSLGGKILFL